MTIWSNISFTPQYCLTAARAHMDPLHPGYHFTAPGYWMNDPNGLIYWKGQYHLFYQHNPYASIWGNMHWGHAVSSDLVHWKHLPIALTPTPSGVDEGGCFSGCAVIKDDKPVMIYTAVFPETQCLAFAAPDPDRLVKYPNNPVIPAPPDGLEVEGFRDPCVWFEDNAWHMLLGSGLVGTGGMVLYYTSPDLLTWEYKGAPLSGVNDPSAKIPTGRMWECPQFFRLGTEDYLILSIFDQSNQGVVVFSGHFANGRFSPSDLGWLDSGGRFFYAPQSFQDEAGRRLLIGWILEERSEEAQVRSYWSGMHSLPRLLTSRPDGGLGQQPVPELASLRTDLYELDQLKITGQMNLPGYPPSGGQLELEFDLHPAFGGLSGILLHDPQSSSQTLIAYDSDSQALLVDTRLACLDSSASGRRVECPLPLAAGQTTHIHLFVDNSVIEVFADGWATITARFYPPDPRRLRLAGYSTAQGAELFNLKVWRLVDVIIPLPMPPIS
jgi:beta-fructofuranosidase